MKMIGISHSSSFSLVCNSRPDIFGMRMSVIRHAASIRSRSESRMASSSSMIAINLDVSRTRSARSWLPHSLRSIRVPSFLVIRDQCRPRAEPLHHYPCRERLQYSTGVEILAEYAPRYPRQILSVTPMTRERDCSVVCGFIDEVSSTVANRPRGRKLGADLVLHDSSECWKHLYARAR